MGVGQCFWVVGAADRDGEHSTGHAGGRKHKNWSVCGTSGLCRGLRERGLAGATEESTICARWCGSQERPRGLRD